MASTMAALLSLAGKSVTNERSIFSTSTGKRCK